MAPPLLLTIAGSDSGGGAGIQADLKTFEALGGFGTSVLTALTSQNTQGVGSVHEVPAAFVREQLDWVVTDLPPAATKIGMLFSAEIVQVVAAAVAHYRLPNVVLDPVMVAKSGDTLLRQEAVLALKASLLPLCTVVTPNLPEAELLCRFSISGRGEMEKAAQLLAETAPAVLLKGGHLAGDTVWDLLWQRGEEPQWFSGPRVDSRNTHGTGCTLSSALAVGLALGHRLPRAVAEAREYVQGALRGSQLWQLGKTGGQGPLHHAWRQR